MILCGVLHVTYQTPETTTGDFMVCVLFNYYFLLAKGIDDLPNLEAVACISLDRVKIDTIQNGQGKQNPTGLIMVCQLTPQACIATDVFIPGNFSSKKKKTTSLSSVHHRPWKKGSGIPSFSKLPPHLSVQANMGRGGPKGIHFWPSI